MPGVGGWGRSGAVEVGGGPGDPVGRHDARCRQGIEIGGNSQHQARWQPAKLPVGQHQRRRRGGMHELVANAQFVAQGNGFGDPGQKGIGGAIQRHIVERFGGDHPTGPF